MRKLNTTEKSESAQLLSMLAVKLRIIDHLIIDSEKNAQWMQRYGLRTRLLVKLLCGANELIQRATCRLYESVYHQVDSANIYSVDFNHMECKRNYTDVHQYSYRLRLDTIDEETKKLAEEMYQFISSEKS